MTMIKNSKNRVKHMSFDERLRRYEQDKQDLFYRMKDMTPEEVADAHAAIREKWRI